MHHEKFLSRRRGGGLWWPADLLLLEMEGYTTQYIYEYMNIALRRFLHNHGNIATEGSPKPGLRPTLISNDFKGSF